MFADEKTGSLAGLGKGGKLVDEGQETSVTNQCHDITVFPTRKLAAGACSGNGIIFDIADPRKPEADRRGQRSGLRLLALGDLQQ